MKTDDYYDQMEEIKAQRTFWGIDFGNMGSDLTALVKLTWNPLGNLLLFSTPPMKKGVFYNEIKGY